jgi:hypothetical protein
MVFIECVRLRINDNFNAQNFSLMEVQNGNDLDGKILTRYCKGI